MITSHTSRGLTGDLRIPKSASAALTIHSMSVAKTAPMNPQNVMGNRSGHHNATTPSNNIQKTTARAR
jgi:hypothetical protein